ncbi:hypothetical protein V5N11_000653 [Cardamine amara subsp. amara]|uniref:Brf1 TBP-binding domain-containing protein n=1 Tax=Cardamine amara subsp. amara TaxID=228776 RepID=A0ABD1B3N3_CARAN
MEKAAREENEGRIGSDEQVNVSKREQQCPEKGQGEKDWASDESDNLSNVDDSEVDDMLLDEIETEQKTMFWNLINRDYNEEQAAKEAALKALNPGNAANCPEYARNLVEASKAAVAKSRKEKRQKRAEEAKNAPPPATAMEAVRRTLERKRLSGLINYDVLEELFDTLPAEKKSRTETVTEKKKEETEEHEIVEDEEDEEAPYEMNTDEKFYEDKVEEEEDGYDFGLY